MNEINEMGPTKKDLLVASSGRDDVNDIPCASCILFCDILHADGTEAESVTEKLMVTPEVNIWRHAIFTTVELKFDSKYNSELNDAFNALEEFKKAQNSMADDEAKIPLVRLCIVPNEYAGRYYLMASNPALWTLAPAGIDGEPRVLSFVIRDEDLIGCDGGEDEEEAEAEEQEEIVVPIAPHSDKN